MGYVRDQLEFANVGITDFARRVGMDQGGMSRLTSEKYKSKISARTFLKILAELKSINPKINVELVVKDLVGDL